MKTNKPIQLYSITFNVPEIKKAILTYGAKQIERRFLETYKNAILQFSNKKKINYTAISGEGTLRKDAAN